MRTILVGTDFSASSERAFAAACDIAQAMGRKVHLLHVVAPVDDPDSADQDTRKFYDSLTALSQVKLEDEESRTPRPVPVSHSVEIGHRAETVARVAQEMDAVMIVLGSRPVQREERPRLSVSHRLAMTSPKPVLLVP